MDLLREVEATHPDARAQGRRWFSAERMELYIWEGPGREPRKFLLSYLHEGETRALGWEAGHGYRHKRIDDGASSESSESSESSDTSDADGAPPHQAAPLIEAEVYLERETLTRRFTAAAPTLPDDIRALVSEALERYPQEPAQALAAMKKKPWWKFW